MSDSIWAIVSGFVKSFGVPIEYALHEVSYVNIVMYCASLPSFQARKEKKKEQLVVNADDPANRDFVEKFLNGEIT